MLRVAVDATPLLGDRTGIGVAVTGMVVELGKRDELELVAYGLTLRGWNRLPAALPDGVRSSRWPLPAGALLRLWQRVDHPPVEAWAGRVDVVHGTNFVVPPARRARRIVTVWDMTPVRFPQMSTKTSLLYPGLVSRAVGAGAWVHTGSQFVAGEIEEHFGVERERIRVVPPGVEVPRRPAGGGSGRPYVVAVGRVEPRKDFPGLVKAFGIVAARLPDVELVIAGPKGWGDDDLDRAIESCACRQRIRRVGWVDDVGDLIAGASAFAFPSLYEGFGLPPLEAMSMGVPVVATAAGSIPEVVGDAAELVPAGDAEALAAALEVVLTDEARRAELRQAGRRRVGAFTWQACSDGMAAAYEALASA